MEAIRFFHVNGGDWGKSYANNSSLKMKGRMEAIQILHMNGGTGEESYANNSTLQRKAITIAKPLIEEAIKDVYCRLLPKTLCISDMGCSSGPNTFYAISLIIDAVDGVRQTLGRESPEFLVHLNDLPSNDFNTIFRSLPKFHEDLKEHLGSEVGPCFLTGVPGSYFERVFPSQSLHFVHSSYALQLLAQAPKGVEGNRGNIYISSTSPSNVADAYLKQFTKDFIAFLRCRAVELVAGGCMALTIFGRRSEDPGAWDSQSVFGPLSRTINDMVNEGLIEEEKLDSFNLPIYFPSQLELKALVKMEGSFEIIRVGLADFHWNGDDNDLSTPDLLKHAGLNVAKTLRAVCEPMLASHFGEHVINDIFSRYAMNVSDCMSKEDTKKHIVTLTLRKIY